MPGVLVRKLRLAMAARTGDIGMEEDDDEDL